MNRYVLASLGWRIPTALLLISLPLTGCSNFTTEAGDSEETSKAITIALGGEPPTLDSQLSASGLVSAITDNVNESLMNRTAEGELIPGLAQEVPTLVNPKTWRFKLRTGIKFSNGEPFNADAVVASVERVLDPTLESEQSSFFPTIEGAKEVDESTVDILTNAPDPLLPQRMYLMKMVPPKYSTEGSFASEPVGTGPYRFVRWARGREVVLESNPDYWGEEPDVSQVTFRFVSEAGTSLSGLLSGEIDLVPNLLPENASQAPKFESVRGSEHPTMILNVDEGLTGDPRVRQALNYAVNKESLVENLYEGYATVDDCQLLSPSWFGYNPSLEPYPYDPEKARSLLADAGAEGAAIEVVGTSGRWLKDKETVEAVANYLSEVGLKPEVRIFEFTEYVNRLLDKKVRPDSIFVSSSNELFDADRTLSTDYHKDGPESSNQDEHLAELIDQARVGTDTEARQELYEQATNLTCDEAYFLFLVNIQDLYGMSDRLEWQPRVDTKLLVQDMTVSS